MHRWHFARPGGFTISVDHVCVFLDIPKPHGMVWHGMGALYVIAHLLLVSHCRGCSLTLAEFFQMRRRWSQCPPPPPLLVAYAAPPTHLSVS